MNAPATIAQLALAREQSQRCEYKAALRNFEAVLTQLDECASTLPVVNRQLYLRVDAACISLQCP